MLNINNLGYFLAVAEYKSITRAAEALYISQQALSNCIMKIEDEFDAPLFVRGKSLQLTPQGELVARRAKEIVELYEKTKEEVQAMKQERKIPFRVGIISSRDILLCPMIQAFHADHPQVELKILSESGDKLAYDVGHGKLDLAVSFLPQKGANVESISIMDDRLYLIIPDDIILASFPTDSAAVLEELERGEFSKLVNVPFLMLTCNQDPDAVFEDVLFHFRDQKPTVLLQTEDIRTVLSMCVSGLGAAFCPQVYLDSFRQLLEPGQEDRFHIIPVPACSNGYFVMYKKNTTLPDYAKDFIFMLAHGSEHG